MYSRDTGYYTGIGLGVAVIAGIAVGSIIGCTLLVSLVAVACKACTGTSSSTTIRVSPSSYPGPTSSSYPATSHANPRPDDFNGPPPSYDQINKPTSYANPHGVQHHPPPPPPAGTFNPVGGHAPHAPVQPTGAYANPAWQAPPPGAHPSSYPPPMAPGGMGDQSNPYADLPPLAQPAPVPQAYVPPPSHVQPPQQLY